jgi:hypothetical protein
MREASPMDAGLTRKRRLCREWYGSRLAKALAGQRAVLCDVAAAVERLGVAVTDRAPVTDVDPLAAVGRGGGHFGFAVELEVDADEVDDAHYAISAVLAPCSGGRDSR